MAYGVNRNGRYYCDLRSDYYGNGLGVTCDFKIVRLALLFIESVDRKDYPVAGRKMAWISGKRRSTAWQRNSNIVFKGNRSW
jgi:hypothetical protein